MKKTILMISAAVLAFGVSLRAQEAPQVVNQPAEAPAGQQEEQKVPEYKYFNHLGIGIGGVLFDGPSISISAPISPYVQIRVGYAALKPFWKYSQVVDLGELGASIAGRDLSNINCEAFLTSSYYGIADIYPFKKRAFHLSVGAYGSSNGDIVNLSADLSKVLTTDEYANLAVTIKNDSGTEQLKVTSDEEGFLRAGLRANNAIRPYFGLGWGRGANIKHRVSVSFDLGLEYAGGVKLYATNFKNGEDGFVTSALLDHKDKLDDAPIVGTQEDIVDQMAEGKFLGGFFNKFWPVMKFGINVRLF